MPVAGRAAQGEATATAQSASMRTEARGTTAPEASVTFRCKLPRR